MTCNYMTFTIASEHYGVALENILEILTYKGFTKIPDSKPWIVGLVQIRNQAMPIIDLRIRFETETKPIYNDTTVIIATKIAENKLLGLIVDTVEDIVEFECNSIITSDEIETGFNSNLVKAYVQTTNGSILILDNSAFAPLNHLPSLSSKFMEGK